jgi:hypothetical protein
MESKDIHNKNTKIVLIIIIIIFIVFINLSKYQLFDDGDECKLKEH